MIAINNLNLLETSKKKSSQYFSDSFVQQPQKIMFLGAISTFISL